MTDRVAGELFDWETADALAAIHGDSYFVFDEQKFRANFARLIDAFSAHYPDVRIGYSYKTNYTPYLCNAVHELGGYAEVVSVMEYDLAKRLGVPGPRIIFNGPYKANAAFNEAAVTGATLNLDSLRDLQILNEVAAAHPDREIGAVIRCNFSLNPDDISHFGMDVDGTEFRATLSSFAKTSNLRLKGLHCHFPDRDLESFGRRAHKMVELAREIFPDTPPEILNIGGGYFSHMPESLRQSFGAPATTFADYGSLVGGILGKAFGGAGRPPRLFLEPGTALVADTFRFYTRVISIKNIRGRKFATVAGSIFDISPMARSRNLPLYALCQEERGTTDDLCDIVGYTCIEKDILAEDVNASLAVGDFVSFENVGSYSIVMKPPFILPANPILVEKGETFEVIKVRESHDYIFQNFVN